MKGSTYTLMKKLIILLGIIAAILAILIPFKAKSQLHIIGSKIQLHTVVSIKVGFEDRMFRFV